MYLSKLTLTTILSPTHTCTAAMARRQQQSPSPSHSSSSSSSSSPLLLVLFLTITLSITTTTHAFLFPAPASTTGGAGPAAATTSRTRTSPPTITPSSPFCFPSPSTTTTTTTTTTLLQASPQPKDSSSKSAASAMAGNRKKELLAEFLKLANADAEVTLEAFYTSGEVAELLKEKLLAKAEVESFWMREVGTKSTPADMEGFLGVYAMIDTLFEDDEDVAEDEEEEEAAPAPAAAAAKAKPAAVPGGMSVEEFMSSGDVARYLEEDLVTKEEVLSFWREEAGVKANDPLPMLTRDASMNVYGRIEELLEDDEEEEQVVKKAPAAAAAAPPVVAAADDDDDDDAALRAEFSKATSGTKDGKMDFATFCEDMGDMPELLADELITREELKEMWSKVTNGGDVSVGVDFEGFKALSAMIDELFLDEEEDEAREEARKAAAAAALAEANKRMQAIMQEEEPLPAGPTIEGPPRPQLMEFLAQVEKAGLLDDENKDLDERVGAIVEAMRDDDINLAVQDDLEIPELQKLIEGDWELAYTTSKTMRFNRGLSGLGSSLPKAEFLGFSQTIVVNGYAYETVYTEKLKTLGQDLDVVVEGSWELKDVVSIMDGEVCLIMDVVPAQIKYGFMTERLETGWKGVRVLNRCELLYLDEELRIMKGQSASYFVFRRRS